MVKGSPEEGGTLQLNHMKILGIGNINVYIHAHTHTHTLDVYDYTSRLCIFIKHKNIKSVEE